MRTTYGSTIFAEHVPDADSLLVERLRRAGAIVIGKTNTPEFGAGRRRSTGCSARPRNPYDLSRTAGGSSGGAAVAVATGSPRSPTDPTWPRASAIPRRSAASSACGRRRAGSRPPTTSPTRGPRSRSLARSRARSTMRRFVLGAVAGRDARDPLSVDAPPDALEPVVPAGLAGMRVAWSRRLIDLPVESEVTAVLEPRRAQLAALGALVADAEPDLRARQRGDSTRCARSASPASRRCSTSIPVSSRTRSSGTCARASR